MTEHELIAGLLKGDESAFKAVVDTYKHMVYNTVLGFVQDTDDADDVTQEVFIKVYENIGSFKQQAKLSTWIYRISITQAMDLVRYRNRKKRGGFILSLFGANQELIYEPADFVHPGVLAENKEQSAILFKAINRLPENQKTAFILQKVQDKGQREIAEIMQMSEGAIESLLSRAKANLKKQLFNYYQSL
ncbi:RNA polymerase sigma factor [Mucilaginibacter mali]|uniref:RNA polymerase sigma factor n=1 Tax=Mucilaginibacter mali TaxID=2740462 RepID=A0A7D4QH15_9SPHI|nr:RNA polymerase sigma factor [Mucilaginibacter mali]QKJ31592.1 RNA polymerase sigma factor [Mucilaginibacter mali]